MFIKTARVQAQVLDAWQVAASASPRSLRKLAHRVEFSYSPRPGYLYFRSRAISSRTNDNHDTFPADEIKAAYKTFLGKPLFVNHHNSNHRRARGVIIAAALHEDRNPDGSPDTWVELLHELDARRFPKLAQAILARRVNRTSMGVDVEWSQCSACGNKATTPAEYCEHLPAKKGLKIRKRAADGSLREEIIHEICHKLAFFENSVLVEDPADPTAHFLGDVDHRGLQVAASKRCAFSSPDTFLSHFEGAVTDPQDYPAATHCLNCGHKLQKPSESPSLMGNWPSKIPHLCNDCYIGHVGSPSEIGKKPGIDYADKGGMGSRKNTDRWMKKVVRGEDRWWSPDDALPSSTSSLLGHFQHVAITGEQAEPGHEVWARPQGLSPSFHEFDERIHTREPEDWYKGMAYHGPYHIVRHPETRVTHVVDAQGRESSSHASGYGNRETDGSWGESQAEKHWHGLESNGPDAHRTGIEEEPSFAVMKERTPAFPHSRIDPQDVQRAQRPDARIHTPEGHSPEDEWHGPYEVVKHPDTGRFHVVDNAGRHAPGSAHLWNGSPTQMQAERSRDYIDRRQQSKEVGRGIANQIFDKGMDILDPGGTEESRQSDRNLQAGEELMSRYAGGRGKIKYDPDDEGGRPHYEREHYLASSGKPSGWYVKHYGGTSADIYHRATGDEAHETLHFPEHPEDRGTMTPRLHPDFDDISLRKAMSEWHDDKEGGARDYLERSDPRIQRWRQRHQGAVEAARYSSPADHPFFQANPASAENLIHAYHDSMADEKSAGSHWYSDAHHVATAIAGGNAARGAGLLAAYSPRTNWPLNMFHASRAHLEGRAPGPGEGPIMRQHQAAAERILNGEHHSAVFQGPKIRAFAHLIEHGAQTPEDTAAGTEKVVVDRHALSAAVGRRLTDEEISAAPIKRPAAYEYVSQMYRDASRHLSQEAGRTISPDNLQATVWLRQQRMNAAEDAGVHQALRSGGGRITHTRNSWQQWSQHSRTHSLPIDSGNMHMQGSRHTAAGAEDITVPAPVDTLRQENCPVCGDSEVYTGQRCPVCGYVSPPSLFRDPDIEHARQVRDQLEENKEEMGLPQGPADEEQMQQGSWPDADEQLAHPDQIAPDGVPAPVAGQPGESDPNDPINQDDPSDPDEDETELLSPDELAAEGEQEQDAGEEEEQEGAEKEQEADDEAAAQENANLICPACGMQFQPGDNGAAVGQPCPACGQAPLQPADDDEAGKEQPDEGITAAMSKGNGNAKITAMGAQQTLIERLQRENAGLRRGYASLQQQLTFIAQLAGCEGELAAIRRQADLMNPASPVPDPPEQPAPESIEQALQPAAQGDASRPGTEPGSVTHVPAAQTTTAITPGVEMQTPPATQLIDVTAPITGTNPSQDGGVPLQQRRIETDVRIDPDPLKAGATQGTAGVPSPNGTAFPWTIPVGGEGPQQQKAASVLSGEAEASQRTWASLRLAKLRLATGLAAGDELDVATRIERDAALSTHDIEREVQVLTAVGSSLPVRSRGRTVPPRTASRAAPSLAAPPAPMMAMTAAALPGDPDNGEDIFLGF